MGQALYRTYRSRSLSEIVGQEHITKTLANALQAGHISHAYLFTGPRGVGKTSVARILAHEINSLPYSQNPHLDIIEIDAASNRRIDDIRELREKVHIAPVSAKYKVYIIDEVHMLTGESFNALLKTLEEPPAHVVFILATTEVHKLPATIISRTQRYTFKPGTPKQVIEHLKSIAQKENIIITDEALALIAARSEGCFRDSLSLLDQLAHISSGEISVDQVSQVLGLAPREQIQQLTANIGNDSKKAIAIIRQFNSQGINISSVVDQLTDSLLQQAEAKPELLFLIDKILDAPRAYNPYLKLITVIATFNLSPSAIAAPVAKPMPTPFKKEPVPKPPISPPIVKEQVTNEPPKIVAEKTAINELSDDDWQQVLRAVQQKSPAIFSVLKLARPQIDNNELTLVFKFSLHSKKIDDPAQKAFVAEVLQTTLGVNPTINVLVDKDLTPPTAPSNPLVDAVTEIMGGGQVI